MRPAAVRGGRGVCSLTAVERSYYRVLGVRPGASPEEVRLAYRGLVRRLHPDHQADLSVAARSLAERRMREINEAWAVLGASDRRARYDDDLHRAARVASPAPAAPSQDHLETEVGFDGLEDVDDLEDVDILRPLSRGEAFLLQRGPWIAAVLIALALLIGTAYAGNARPRPAQTPSSLQSGIECVDTPAEPCGP